MSATERLPEDIEAEQALLSTLCSPGADHAAALFCPQLLPDDFAHPKHRLIFVALKGVLAARQEVSPFTLKAQLEGAGALALVGDMPGLFEFLNYPEVSRPEVLVQILQGKRRLRELIRLGGKITRHASEGLDDPEGLISRAQESLRQISQDGRLDESESWVEILHDMSSFEPFRAGKVERGGFWGVPDLDAKCPIPAGEYTALGARPGVGKTAFLGQIAVTSAMNGFTPLIVQMELPRMTQRGRLASFMAEVSMQRLKMGSYEENHISRLAHYREALGRGRTLPLSAGTPWGKVEAMIRYEIDRHGVDLVLLDQFDKIGREQVQKGSNEAYAFGRVSIGIMALAQETGVGFVVLGQLKGDADDREPILSDFADSDRLAKDPGVAVHLYRDKATKCIKAKIQKNRDGAWVNHRVLLDFDGERSRFSDQQAVPARREAEPVNLQFEGIDR